MSLFAKLLHLHSDEHSRLEDFHTEIVAHVLASDSELTLRWLQKLRVTKLCEADKIAVWTQQRLEPIEGLHSFGSKPDITIRIRKGERFEVVFVESKVGSAEGPGQLSKYVEQLRARPGVDQRSLVFITRDYEPKENLSDDDVQFFQTRWSDFYRFLRADESASDSDTIRELLKFMQEKNMSQSNRFTAIELLALTNHHRARSLMDATMWEDVAKKFLKVCGATGSATKAMTQLRLYKRYVMEADHGAPYQFSSLLGYWFPDEQPSDSPKIGMQIAVEPKAAQHPAIVKAMHKFSEGSKRPRKWDWHPAGGDDWEEIQCTRKLEDFLAEEDHVAAIRKWFEELLDDAAAFRKQNPKLPWSVRAAEGEDK